MGIGLATVEQRDRVAALKRIADLVRTDEAGTAQDQDAQLVRLPPDLSTPRRSASSQPEAKGPASDDRRAEKVSSGRWNGSRGLVRLPRVWRRGAGFLTSCGP